MSLDAAHLEEMVAGNLAAVRDRIRSAGGDEQRVRILAVTKTFAPSYVAAAVHNGLVEVGENYADELISKAAALAQMGVTGISWNFIGEVQRNKLARLAPVVDCYQGIDRLEEGEGIARRHPGARVLVEIDTAGIPGRGGVSPSDVPTLIEALRRLELDVAGLMTVAPPERDPARAAFRLVAEMRDDLGLMEASMGMSDDLELAVEAGSTMVRIGSALFGHRASPGAVSQ